MENIKILDNLLSVKEISYIQSNIDKLFRNNSFQYMPYTSDDSFVIKREDIYEAGQFVKTIVVNDQFTENYSDALLHSLSIIGNNFYNSTNIKLNHLYKLKVNIQLQQEKVTGYNSPHIDLPFFHKVLLYYIDDSDGDTYFFNKRPLGLQDCNFRVSPKAGRLVLFNGDIFHAGTHPMSSKHRRVINFCFS